MAPLVCMFLAPKWNIFFRFPPPITNAKSRPRMKEVSYRHRVAIIPVSPASPARMPPHCITNMREVLPINPVNWGVVKSPNTLRCCSQRKTGTPIQLLPSTGRDGSRGVGIWGTYPPPSRPKLTLRCSWSPSAALRRSSAGPRRLGTKGEGPASRNAGGLPVEAPRRPPNLEKRQPRRQKKDAGRAGPSWWARPPPATESGPRAPVRAPCRLCASPPSAPLLRRAQAAVSPHRARACATVRVPAAAVPPRACPGRGQARRGQGQRGRGAPGPGLLRCVLGSGSWSRPRASFIPMEMSYTPGNYPGICDLTTSYQVSSQNTGLVLENEKKKTPKTLGKMGCLPTK